MTCFWVECDVCNILLTEKKLHHLGCIKPAKTVDKLPTSTGSPDFWTINCTCLLSLKNSAKNRCSRSISMFWHLDVVKCSARGWYQRLLFRHLALFFSALCMQQQQVMPKRAPSSLVDLLGDAIPPSCIGITINHEIRIPINQAGFNGK